MQNKTETILVNKINRYGNKHIKVHEFKNCTFSKAMIAEAFEWPRLFVEAISYTDAILP